MAVTNTKFKVTDVDRRNIGEANLGDHTTQPRLLQPVAQDTDITTANGFKAADLKPGDMMFVADGQTAGKASLYIRNAANNGWIEFVLDTVQGFITTQAD